MPGDTPLTDGEAKLVIAWLAISTVLALIAVVLIVKAVVSLIWG